MTQSNSIERGRLGKYSIEGETGLPRVIVYLLSAVAFIITSPTTVQFFLREYVCERVEGGWH